MSERGKSIMAHLAKHMFALCSTPSTSRRHHHIRYRRTQSDKPFLTIAPNPLTRRLLERLLRQSGYWPTVVSNELEALDALERTTFTAITMIPEPTAISGK